MVPVWIPTAIMLVPNAETPLATAPEKIIKVRRVLGYRLGIKKNVYETWVKLAVFMIGILFRIPTGILDEKSTKIQQTELEGTNNTLCAS